MDNFQLGLQWIKQAEGKFVCDDGGPTNYGVTQTVLDEFENVMGRPHEDVENITQQEVEELYQDLYWNKAHCQDLPVHTSIAVFDFAVNSGVGTAIKHLQRVVKVVDDGIFGPGTLAGVHQFSDGALSNAYINDHKQFFDSLDQADPQKYDIYYKGWLNRISNLRQFIASLK